MISKSHVAKLGNGLAVCIPKPVVEQLGIQEGSAIEILLRGDSMIIRRETYSLDDMLTQISEDNLHPEQNAGSPQGNEEW